MDDKKKQASIPVTSCPGEIRLKPSMTDYASCMKLTALALGYPEGRPLRVSPSTFVLSLTGLGYSFPLALPGKT
jgi:hypothetical protein